MKHLLAFLLLASTAFGQTPPLFKPESNGSTTIVPITSAYSLKVPTSKLLIRDASDTTKLATFDASGITAGQTRSFTFPDFSGTLVTVAGTQTLTNKTLTSPVLTTPDIGTPSAGVVTNLTGTASININGTVGATTPAAGTFTTLGSTGNTTVGDASGDGLTVNAASWTLPNTVAWSKTSQASTAETLYTMTVSDDATGMFQLVNGSAADGFFDPSFLGVQGSTRAGLNFTGKSTTDTGTNPCLIFIGQIGTSDVATRPVMSFRNRINPILDLTAGYNLKVTAPATSPTLNAAVADSVFLAGVDNGAGNRELQVQPESGGYWATGSDTVRRVPNANRDLSSRLKSVTTTNGTITTADTIAITASSTYLIESRFVARRTGGTSGTAEDSGSYVRRGTYKTVSGTVTLVGTVQTIGTDAEDQAGWDATLTISSTNVLPQVTGAANNNISWQVESTVQRISQ